VSDNITKYIQFNTTICTITWCQLFYTQSTRWVKTMTQWSHNGADHINKVKLL